MRTPLLLTVALLLARVAVAQDKPHGGTITGIVLDEAGNPVVDADVFALPDTKRARTDSTGHFALANLDPDFYHVRVRRLGFMPTEITTDLGKNGHVDLKFELARRPVVLDSVVVTEDGRCPALNYNGFNCRKSRGKGVYLTDDDLADRGAIELGDVFRNVDGFRIETAFTAFGPKPKPLATHGGNCLNALINGRPLAVTNPLPRYATELLGVEIYASPRDVPQEYQRYVWQGDARQTTTFTHDRMDQPCSLVVYWTTYAGTH